MNRGFSYDRIASVYDLLSFIAFFGQIQRAQRHFLTRIPKNSKVLFLGGGTGWLFPHIFRISCPQHITYIEASAKMISRSQRTVVKFQQQHPDILTPPITFICGTEEQIPSTASYDVVVTNFLLDMYSGPKLLALVHRITQQLSSEAIWLFSDFQLSQRPLQRIWQKPLLALMYYFFHFTAGINIQPLPNFLFIFDQIGWHATHSTNFVGGFITSQVYRRAKDVIPDAVAANR